MQIPRHPQGTVDWTALIVYLRARWSNRANSADAKRIRRDSDEWRARWKEAGCPPANSPDCPPFKPERWS